MQHHFGEQWLADVFFADYRHGWICGVSGLIYHTSDSGQNWTKQKSHQDNSLNDLFFINPNEGWIVGGHGTVLHTINGGKVWRPQQCETQFNLNTIHMMNQKLGWIAGDLGTILRHKVIEMFPKSYKSFTMEVLEEAENIGGENLVNQLFTKRMESQIQSYTKRLQGKNLNKKIKELAKIRSEEGYMAKVSKNGDNYSLVEYHCPISMIAKKYRILCETEKKLFQRVLGVEVKREHHLMCGSHKCSYYIQT